MADRDGNPILLNTRYLVVGRAISDDGATVQLEIDKQIYEVTADQTLPVTSVVAGTVVAAGSSRLGAMIGQDGEPGEDGLPGSAGAVGAAGVAGADGIDGADGAEGAVGATGAQGIPGDPGSAGATGPQGDPGTPGANGTNGTNGLNGATGVQGYPGIDGADGEMGMPGLRGATGLRGLSAPIVFMPGEEESSPIIIQSPVRDPWTRVLLTSDANKSTAGWLVTDLKFDAQKTRHYEVEGLIHVRSADVANRPIIYMYWPDNLVDGSGSLRLPIGNNASVEAYGDPVLGSNFATPVGDGSWPDTTRSYQLQVRASFQTGSVGVYPFYILLEPSAPGTNVTFKAGSWIRYREVP